MSPRSPHCLLLVFAAVAFVVAAGDSDLASELAELRSRSPSGVIHLDDRSVSRFLTLSPTPRPYSLIIFFDAVSLRDKPDLHLRHLRSEFALVSAASAANLDGTLDANKIFFCDIEFQESQSSFALFRVNSLPHLRHVGPDAKSLADSDPMDQSGFSGLADSMAEFAVSKTGLPVGPIARPPPVSTKQIAFVLLALVISTPYLVKRVLDGDTFIHDPRFWMGLAVFVYFFSVSGAMHNIIRKMPMFLTDRNDPSKLVFFYQGSGMQLGAEGFAVGFLYTVVGLMIAFVTRVLVRVKNVGVQRGVMLGAMIVSYLAVSKVVHLDSWKTGYGIHAFWPSSWK